MDKMSIFVALTGIAVLLQAGVLLAIYIAMRKSTQHLEELAGDVKTKVMPTVTQAQEMIADLRPKIETIVGNFRDTTTVLRSEVQRVDAAVNVGVVAAVVVIHSILRDGAQNGGLAGQTDFRARAGYHRRAGVSVRRSQSPEWRREGAAACPAG